MAWASMHFAVGMAGGAAISGIASLVVRRGWRFMPVAMTVGGVWAVVPDMPRLFRVDFPWLPLSSILGSKDLEHQLHAMGNLFFFHQQLDLQPRELALHGIIAMIVLYNAAIALLLFLEWKQRDSFASRVKRVHRESKRQTRSRRRVASSNETPSPIITHPDAQVTGVIGRIDRHRAS